MHLFVICHDDKSLEMANLLSTEWTAQSDIKNKNESNATDSTVKTSSDDSFSFSFSISINVTPVLLPPSPYMESSIYPFLAQQQYKTMWEKEDYVGIVTYSILDKLGKFKKQAVSIDWQTIIKQANEKDIDVIGLFCLDFKRGEKSPITLLESAVFHHGFNFYRGWRDLLLAMGYSQNKIDDCQDMSGFFCNWWVAKPQVLKEYIMFVARAMDKIQTNEALSKVFFRNSHYGTGNTTDEQKLALFGKDYYTIHPFVFERLLSFYLNRRNENVGNVGNENENKLLKIGSINRMVMRI